MSKNPKTIEELKKLYKVTAHKELMDGLIAIHKKIAGEYYWLYFRNYGMFYVQTGSTRILVK